MKNSMKKSLSNMGFSLPKSIKVAGSYVPFLKENKNYGYKAAQLCALNILGLINIAIKGNFSEIIRCVRINGFVNCEKSFFEHPFVINGASDLIKKILKKKGLHTRTAIGVSSLPFNASVEVDAIFLTK